jgi:predicted metalloprotease with PDZ domain
VVQSLNKLVRYDWNDFFQKRVYDINPRAPLGGIEGSGWRLAFTNTVSDLLKAREGVHKYTDLRYSLGFTLKEDGTILDIVPDSPADKSGVGPGMKLLGVDGRRWKPELLRTAIKSAQTNQAPLELLLENSDYFKTCKVDYHSGEKYPCLERDSTKPDMLADILKSKATK